MSVLVAAIVLPHMVWPLEKAVCKKKKENDNEYLPNCKTQNVGQTRASSYES